MKKGQIPNLGMITINIERDKDLEQPNVKVCCKILRTVLEDQGVENGTVTVIFGQDNLVSNLKNKFFHKNQLTDVIAFRLNNYTEKFIEGEVYIGLMQAKKNAKFFREPFEKEVSRLIIHGGLHLLGHDDKTKKSKQEMTRLEENYLKRAQWKKLFIQNSKSSPHII